MISCLYLGLPPFYRVTDAGRLSLGDLLGAEPRYCKGDKWVNQYDFEASWTTSRKGTLRYPWRERWSPISSDLILKKMQGH